MKIICSKQKLSLGVILAATNNNCEIEWSDNMNAFVPNENVMEIPFPSDDIAEPLRMFARLYQDDNTMGLYGNTSDPNVAIFRTEIDQWLCFANFIGADCTRSLPMLNQALATVTFIAGKQYTIADVAIFTALYYSNYASILAQTINEKCVHLNRWYNHMMASKQVQSALKLMLSYSVASKPREGGGKYVELPGAEIGKVLVRFPPEASGYLHIGHAKAALLNQYYQQAFNGRLILRFDDTNPSKENVEFEKVILEDVEMLQIKPDVFTYTSDYFELMLAYCEYLLSAGKAYVDNTDAAIIKVQREQRIESTNRNNDVDKNLKMWHEMVKGSTDGQRCCVRALIDMSSLNGCMRDPIIYRCKVEVHPRTGRKYNVYPTYDFACPIVDALEGVTHTLRTMEYHDRDEQFYWFIEALGLRRPHIWEFSRLSMTHTVLSKRKLTWFVENRLVDGWEDARMPTVRGILRRGMTVTGLREFIVAQGSSRSVVFMEWDKIWAINKKCIDPVAPRYTALEWNDTVKVHISGVEEQCISVGKHPKNAKVGTKSIWIGSVVLVNRFDADRFQENTNVTFINWGNLRIKKIERSFTNSRISRIEAVANLLDTNYKDTLKITWLAVTEKAPFTPTWCTYFDHLIVKPLLGKEEDFKNFINTNTMHEVQMVGDPELRHLKTGDIIQLQRVGYFRVDVGYKPTNLYSGKEQPIILFHIPDGHSKNIPNISSSNSETTAVFSENLIADDIVKVEDLVRKMKTGKVEKRTFDVAVSTLLSLKAKYKESFGVDWKPPINESKHTCTTKSVDQINEEITNQGNIVRKLKAENADKTTIDDAVSVLLSLKNEYKSMCNTEWKPSNATSPTNSEKKTASKQLVPVSDSPDKIHDEIVKHGNLVRNLKAKKADKNNINQAVSILLSLKADYKRVTGIEWTPDSIKTSGVIEQKQPTVQDISNDIVKQSNLVRNLKAQKADKQEIDAVVAMLLLLKSKYKLVTGGEGWKPLAQNATSNEHQVVTQKKKKKEKPGIDDKPLKTSQLPLIEDTSKSVKKQTRLGLEAKKEENLSEWYSQIITKAELIEYYDVSGCYILRPWSYAIWDAIRVWFDAEIKKLNVQNCYFPLFVSRNALEREKAHIKDFAPEVAWVTKSGETDMCEPVAIRPTSETIMYPAYAKWIQSYRDLPIKLNQWNNVVRWEFKHPQPFLRTREFLWQEGHSAYAAKEEADAEVATILDLYSRIYTDLLAVPVIKGRKTEKEKFAGGEYTLTVEAFIAASGRGIQGGTSHHLGQNFSRMFEIVYECPDTHEKKYVYQNSWGITTRTIGILIMVHADNRGLVLPPRVATIQIVIIPCGITVNTSEELRRKLHVACSDVERDLKGNCVRVEYDFRANYSPGWKFNNWELKGVPIRVEIGPKDLEQRQIVAVRRDTGERFTVKRNDITTVLQNLLEEIQANLLTKATDQMHKHIVVLKHTDWSQFTHHLDSKKIILTPFCGQTECEDRIKADTTSPGGGTTEDEKTPSLGVSSMGAKSLCIPLEQCETITDQDKCIYPECKSKPQFYTLFGRSY